MDKQSIYIHQKEAIETTQQKVYRTYTEGDQKPIPKKGSKQKQTSPPDELENTQNASYKGVLHVMNQASPRTDRPKEAGLQSGARKTVVFKHYFVPLLLDCPHQTKRNRPPKLCFLLPLYFYIILRFNCLLVITKYLTV